MADLPTQGGRDRDRLHATPSLARWAAGRVFDPLDRWHQDRMDDQWTRRPLIMIHGGGADHIRLVPSAGLLADRFTTHLVDRRGRRMSGDAQTDDIGLEYDDIAAVADTIGQQVTAPGTPTADRSRSAQPYAPSTSHA